MVPGKALVIRGETYAHQFSGADISAANHLVAGAPVHAACQADMFPVIFVHEH